MIYLHTLNLNTFFLVPFRTMHWRHACACSPAWPHPAWWYHVSSALCCLCMIHATLQTLQHAATCCNTLEHAAKRCNTLQHTGTYCSFMLAAPLCCLCMICTHTTPHSSYCSRHYNDALCMAIDTHTLQHAATHCNTLQHTATHCSYCSRAYDDGLCMSIVTTTSHLS